jgi:hypothetical protein
MNHLPSENLFNAIKIIQKGINVEFIDDHLMILIIPKSVEDVVLNDTLEEV